MRAVVALSMNPRGEDAAREATSQIRAALGDSPVSGALCWVSPEHADDLQRLLPALCLGLGTRVLAGCVSAGVTVGGREVMDGPALGLMAFTEANVEARLLHDLYAEPERAAREALHGAGPQDLVVLMPTASTFKATPFLDVVASQHPLARVIGGGAANPDGDDLVFTGQGLSRDGLAALVIRDCQPEVRLTQSCRSLSRGHLITRCEGADVLELDGKPALQVLAALLAARDDGDDSPLLAGHAGPGDRVGAEGLFVRPFMGLDRARAAVRLSQPAQEGDALLFLTRAVDSSRADLNAMMIETLGMLRRRRPAFALMTNCAGRGAEFQGIPDYDAAVVSGFLDGVPLAGFFGGFELGPFRGKTQLHLFSAVLAVGG